MSTWQRHDYLLIGHGATIAKERLALRRPTRAGIKTETFWNNRFTPLPLGVYVWVRQEEGRPPHTKIRRPDGHEINLPHTTRDMGSDVLSRAQGLGLPRLQPSTSSGLFPDTHIRSYEELYEQDDVRFIFTQGMTFFAFNHDEELVFTQAEPQAVHLTIETTHDILPHKVVAALDAAHALPTVTPADYAQHITRRQPWWRGGNVLANIPLSEQIPQLRRLELESKLDVQGDFSTISWRLADMFRQDEMPGFTLYRGDRLLRLSHNIVCYLQRKHKLILHGTAYRVIGKGKAPSHVRKHTNGSVLAQLEDKPLYSPITTFETARAIHTQRQSPTMVGEMRCHKRKFILESLATGGGYHVSVDRCTTASHPREQLLQIEVECQWQKIPPWQTFPDPITVTLAEIQQVTQALREALDGVQPTSLTKRRWLQHMVQRRSYDCPPASSHR